MVVLPCFGGNLDASGYVLQAASVVPVAMYSVSHDPHHAVRTHGWLSTGHLRRTRPMYYHSGSIIHVFTGSASLVLLATRIKQGMDAVQLGLAY